LQGNRYFPNLGNSTAAKDSYDKALQVAESLSAKNPGDVHARLDVAQANVKLVDIFSLSGDITETLKRYRKWQQVFESLAPNDPQTKADLRADLKMVTQRIGTIQLQQGDLAGALESYSRYLQIAQDLYQANPSDPSARRSVALAFEKVGELMAQTGAVAEGLLKLGNARALYEQNLTANPQKHQAFTDLASIDIMIGDTLAVAKKNEEAVKSFRQSLDVMRKLVAEDPKDMASKQLLIDVLLRLRTALYTVGERGQARATTVDALQVLRPMLDGPDPKREIEQYCELLLTTPFKDLRQPTLARQLANRLDAYYLDVLAQALHDANDAAQAVEIEKKALALLPVNVVSEQKKLLEANLAKFSAPPERKQAK
jgi:tetratricopeptide (TPR) repeat protein